MCPKCKSSDVGTDIGNASAVALGVQIGSVALMAVALPLGIFAAFLALHLGAVGGGVLGAKLTEANECQNCGHRWG